MSVQPNILLIMADQMRADSFGLAGHPSLITPNIDNIAGRGCMFTRAYSTCPSCIPARRSLLTGQFPATSGSVGFETPPYDTPTLPGILSADGYESVLVGRNMHQHESNQNPGYGRCVLGATYVEDDAYAQMLNREKPELGGIRGIGIDFNGWQAKSWPLEERFHPTNWVSRKAREVVAAHDGKRPLFLTASYYAPHPPLIPPDFYYRRYLDMDLPEAYVGDWVEPIGERYGVANPRVRLEGEPLRMARAAYYGLINHLDDQLTYVINDFLRKSLRQKRPWVICITSDHGEMLGDHHYFRKCEPFEGSARIPLPINTGELGQKGGMRIGSPVCLEDLLPTLLDFASLEPPEGIDGISLAPVLRGERESVRTWLHCEHSPCYSDEQAFQMITDGKWKCIWRPMTGKQHLFDLENDPGELHDLAGKPDCSGVLTEAKQRLTERLAARPEGFVADGELRKLSEPYPPVIVR